MWYYDNIPITSKVILSALAAAAYLKHWPYKGIRCCFALLLMYCTVTFFGASLSLYILSRFIVGKMVCVIIRTAWNVYKNGGV